MNFGKLRYKIDLQCETRVADGLGGFTTTWYDMFTSVWADIAQPDAKDVYKFGRLLDRVTTKVTIRYNKSVKPGWRVVYGDVVYSVLHSMNVDMKNRETLLFCEEII